MTQPPYPGQPPTEPQYPGQPPVDPQYSGQPPVGPPYPTQQYPAQPPVDPQYSGPPAMDPQYPQTQYMGQPAFGGYPPPPAPDNNKRTLLIVGGIAAVVVFLLLATAGVVFALRSDDKGTPIADPSASSPAPERSSAEPDDEQSPSEEDDGGEGGTHKPVEHMCEKLDGTPLVALYDTVYGKPSESLRNVGDVDLATCVTSLTKGSNRAQHAMVTCSGFYHQDTAAASRFYDYNQKSAESTLAKGPVEEIPGLGDKAIIYPTSTSTSLQSFVVLILDDNLVLQARVMASHASGAWTPATATQLKQAVIASAKATLPKVTSS